jgi:NAD(P)-dependent dehydrogenase (short-subunit alcohol dehydrogenase family)
MTDQKVWLITGAGRGMGVDIAKAALAAGNRERRHTHDNMDDQ